MLNSVLASLFAVAPGFTQSTRLLQLTTPLGPNRLLAECVRGEEGIGEGFVFRISALSNDAAIALIERDGRSWND